MKEGRASGETHKGDHYGKEDSFHPGDRNAGNRKKSIQLIGMRFLVSTGGSWDRVLRSLKRNGALPDKAPHRAVSAASSRRAAPGSGAKKNGVWIAYADYLEIYSRSIGLCSSLFVGRCGHCSFQILCKQIFILVVVCSVSVFSDVLGSLLRCLCRNAKAVNKPYT